MPFLFPFPHLISQTVRITSLGSLRIAELSLTSKEPYSLLMETSWIKKQKQQNKCTKGPTLLYNKIFVLFNKKEKKKERGLTPRPGFYPYYSFGDLNLLPTSALGNPHFTIVGCYVFFLGFLNFCFGEDLYEWCLLTARHIEEAF